MRPTALLVLSVALAGCAGDPFCFGGECNKRAKAGPRVSLPKVLPEEPPPGTRAVTVRIDDGSADLASTGRRVDLLVMWREKGQVQTEVAVEAAYVLAREDKGAAQLLTVALPPELAQKAVAADQKGELTVLLRNDEDLGQ
jgi:Flp pilus assembly protein CpaB